MTSIILRKLAYEGTYIYVWQRGYKFEYLYSWDTEIYRQEVYFTQPWYKRLLSIFGYQIFSSEELEGIEKAMISGAVASIDLLRNPLPIPTEDDVTSEDAASLRPMQTKRW